MEHRSIAELKELLAKQESERVVSSGLEEIVVRIKSAEKRDDQLVASRKKVAAERSAAIAERDGQIRGLLAEGVSEALVIEVAGVARQQLSRILAGKAEEVDASE